ncbi:hypothetical protein P5G60_10265 [Paenibacillus jamilae]|nr:hypothetical protein [Paenibacillus jamilae]
MEIAVIRFEIIKKILRIDSTMYESLLKIEEIVNSISPPVYEDDQTEETEEDLQYIIMLNQ